MTTTNAPDTVPAPAVAPPPARRGLGSLRSMVISMVVIMLAVLAWVAMVPRVREVSQPAVDVTAVATQARRETGWAISQPRLPTGWRATSVRFTKAADGHRTWHAGYLSPEGNYVSIDQTDVSGATDDWISTLTTNGRSEGTLSAAGMTWRKLSSGDTVQRSLLLKGSELTGSELKGSELKGSELKGSGSTGSGTKALTTLLSGTAPYAQLVQFAEALELVPAPAS